MKNRILVTAALPYANGPIHIGHLVEYIQTDIFVRFLKLVGQDAIYCCADDTHGTPIEINAKKQGMKPEEFIEKWHKEHTEDFAKFLIEFDSYYSTNSEENKKHADFFFNTLKSKGYIYTKTIKITYCEKCKRSLPDRFVKGKCPNCGAEEQYGDVCEKCGKKYDTTDLVEPKCAICGTKPVLKDSVHYFFKLGEFSERLERWLETNEQLQDEIKHYVLNWIKEGLKDWDISRDGPYFGFKIPGEDNKYYYVWLDAPIGYISSTENYCKKHKLDVLNDYWKNPTTKIYHVIGKEIVYFHFLFWPAMLMGVGYNLPFDIVVHGMLTVNKEKMSKSRGTMYTAKEFLEKYPNPEYLRYYYAGLLSKKIEDVDLNIQEFIKSVNSELVGNLSNFCYRTISFANKNLNSQITEFDENEVKELIKQMNEKFKEIRKDYAEFNFKEALKIILEISAMGNKYFQDNEPWKTIHTDIDKTGKVISFCLNIVKNLSILVQPILPKFSESLQRQMKLKKLRWDNLGFDLKEHKIGNAEMLATKIV